MQMDLFGGGSPGGGDGGGVEVVPLHQAARTRYLNYALSVITSRALPDVRDGLKPVQRRILYAMFHELRLRPESRYVKSARVVGDVMGKYHPHGDQAIYDAMVRMAQPFSLRYPLVDGQGNFGSIDGDPPAAMRYTECKLLPLAEELLTELRQRTVDFRPTYDGQLFEPIVLPAQFPNLLVNGTTGIAVGMATNIPPHNMTEVCRAAIAMIDDPDITLDALVGHVRGPDFPTGGEILSAADELRAIYETGHGAVRVRGEYTTEVVNRQKCVVITSIPYALNKAALIEKIAQHIAAKKVPQLTDIRDESTDDVRIVMELKKGADVEAAMAYLYKHTPLQQNFNVNLTCLVPGEDREIGTPKRLGLREILRYFLDFRMEVVTRRLEYELEALRERIHLLEGLEIIFDMLDEAIAIIRASEGKADAAKRLMQRFPIDEVQTDYILELKLYRLARLEILLIRQELAEKRAEAARIEALLANEGGRWKIVRKEIAAVAEAYGDERRTKLVGPQKEIAFDPEAYIVREQAWVIVTRHGRVKRQKNFGGIEATRVPDGDEVGWVVRTDTLQTVTFYTTHGSAYVMRVDSVPATTGYGEPVQSFFNFEDGEHLCGVTCSDPRVVPRPAEVDLAGLTDEDPRPPFALAISEQGKTVRFPLAAHTEVSTRSGRKYMSLAEGDRVVAVHLHAGDENVAVASRGGHVLIFPVREIPPRAGAARGVLAIKLDEKDRVLGYQLTTAKRDGLVCFTNRGREIIVRETSYHAASRGGRGTVVIRLGGLERCVVPVVILQPPDEEQQPPSDGGGDEGEGGEGK